MNIMSPTRGWELYFLAASGATAPPLSPRAPAVGAAAGCRACVAPPVERGRFAPAEIGFSTWPGASDDPEARLVVADREGCAAVDVEPPRDAIDAPCHYVPLNDEIRGLTLRV